MTEPQTPPPFDPVHPAVGAVQAWLSLGKHKTPQGEMLILTVRVPNATVTAVMNKADAQHWVDTIQTEINGLSSLAIAPANTPLTPMNGHPRG